MVCIGTATNTRIPIPISVHRNNVNTTRGAATDKSEICKYHNVCVFDLVQFFSDDLSLDIYDQSKIDAEHNTKFVCLNKLQYTYYIRITDSCPIN